MSIVSSEVGIDVCSHRLDVSVQGSKVCSYSNDGEGCDRLASHLPSACVVHLESSGGYERLVRRVLHARGFVVKVHNPLRVRRSAQAEGIGAKTDVIDAKHLANRGSRIKAERVKSQEAEDLCDLSRAIDEFKRVAGRFKVIAQKPQCDSYAASRFLESARELDQRASEMQLEFERRLKLSTLGPRFELARSVPGVGPNLARVVTCELPERLEDFSDAQLCAYSSTAPFDEQSGKRSKPARIRPANMRLKGALYMPALVCVRGQPWARDLYARLRAKGRSHRQAIVAVMRRLFLRIVQVLKRGSAWKPEPLKT